MVPFGVAFLFGAAAGPGQRRLPLRSAYALLMVVPLWFVLFFVLCRWGYAD